MRKILVSVSILFLFSFCQKEFSAEPACGTVFDWSSYGVPNFQGNCYLVTNAQIRWLQQNGYISNINTAPNNGTCPTKQQILDYTNGGLCKEAGFDALGSSNCVPIGYICFAV